MKKITTLVPLLLSSLLLTTDSIAEDIQPEIKTQSVARQFDAVLPEQSSSPAAILTRPATQAVKSRDAVVQFSSPDFWIYDSWTEFTIDADYDGYYSAFSVTFDADTVYSVADVYAIIYLGRLDRFEAIYETRIFSISGDDSLDAITIDSDLVSGFPPADYSVLIELYDAYTHELVAIADDYDDADLSLLSLESQNHDQVIEERVVIVEQHGGSLSWLTALALLGAVGWRAATGRRIRT
ncbi:choice-of-anchor H family protein [Alteromonas sp. CYL-A6]|uniref:choice-of-anchor H family protein n=1 Tax=Alteromonas nitratireducens TaxID=3390813 RepID=UPI0034B15301